MSHSHSTTELDTYPVASTPPTSISRHGGALGVAMGGGSKRNRGWSKAKLTNLMHLFNRWNPPSTESHGAGTSQQQHTRGASLEDYRIHHTAPRLASLDSIALRMDLAPPPMLNLNGNASVSAARGSTASERRKTSMSVDIQKPLPRVPRLDGPVPGPDDGFIFNLHAPCRPDLRPSSHASVVIKVCRLPKIYRGALLEKFGQSRLLASGCFRHLTERIHCRRCRDNAVISDSGRRQRPITGLTDDPIRSSSIFYANTYHSTKLGTTG